MTDKPFDHEEYSRARLQQTTPGEGSDFKGHLVHRPGRIETTPGAGEGWPPHPWVPDLLIDHDAPVCEICGEGMAAHTEESLLFQEYMTLHNAREAVPAWALIGRDGEPVTLLQKLEQSMEFGSAMEKLAIENNSAREADQQTIADLRAETERWQEFANGYMRDLTAAEQTIAELQQALAAERERAEKAEGERDGWIAVSKEYLGRVKDTEAELQAEREKSAEYEQLLTTAQPVIVAANLKIERLEALAGLATWLYEQLPIGVDLTEFRTKYRALTTQAYR